MPDERYRAVLWAEEFLKKLSDPVQTTRLPKSVRYEAQSILRHFPNNRQMQQVANQCPTVFQQEMEPLYRMVKQHEQIKENDDNKNSTG